jgi:formylglycine-generating enzyme required for sulfatase activity
VAGAGTAVAWFTRNHKPPAPAPFAFQANVPAGEFIYRDGQRLSLPEFWIDSHEVSIGQYAEFLRAIAGDKARKFDNEKQPPEKTGHEPKDWQAIYGAAAAGGWWNGYPVSLNCPVFNVDWWDAFAYASWKGRRLPTEQEWEKAARGTNGRQWPWGSEPDPKRANTGADYAEQPGSVVGAIDGHVWWCEVNAMPQDVSPYGVVGMAGNVSEWTDSLAIDPDLPDVKVRVFRGGDFRRESPAAITTPWLAKSPTYAQPFLGFRTASSSPPQE